MLYVANCTKQGHDFIFRLPEEKRTQKLFIPAGGQVMVLNGGSGVTAVRGVVEQHARYGLVPVTEIDRTKPFIGMCYSLDKPIPVAKILRAAEHNDGVLEERSLEERRVTAGAMHSKLSDPNEHPIAPVSLEVETIERTKDDTGMNQIVQITRDGKPRRRRVRPAE